jgi:putative serine protease PepD
MSENQTAFGEDGTGRPRTAEHTTLTQPVTPAPPASVWAQPSPAAPSPAAPSPAAPSQEAPGHQAPRYEAPGYQAPGYGPTQETPGYPTGTQAYPIDPSGPPQRTATGGGWRRGAVATVAAAAIALTAGGIGGFVGYSLHDEASPLQNTPATNNNVNVVDRSSLADIASKVQPTVVDVKTESGEGSGVVISADGYVVTNNHVVATARGDEVTVTFNSGRNLTGRIVGADAKTDIAVVKVDATGLTFASWGNSDKVQVGDTVLAIGSPLGLEGSVTAGIVSALHRTISVGEQNAPFGGGGAQTTIGDAIQTDAAINQGNSGGALVNLDGQIIGINSAIATSGSSGNIGVGFAISSNRAKAVAEQIMKGQKVSHPYLGVSVGDADGGAQIQSISSGGPAAQAGLQVGDVVTKIGDRAIANSEDLVGAIQSSQVGAQLNLTVQRGGSERTMTVTVGEAP